MSGKWPPTQPRLRKLTSRFPELHSDACYWLIVQNMQMALSRNKDHSVEPMKAYRISRFSTKYNFQDEPAILEKWMVDKLRHAIVTLPCSSRCAPTLLVLELLTSRGINHLKFAKNHGQLDFSFMRHSKNHLILMFTFRTLEGCFTLL